MSTIVAGRFDTFDNAQIASKKIIEHGTTAENVSVFYVTPQGQHARTPIGGDATSDEGAKSAHKGAWKGILAGALIGTALGYAAQRLVGAPWLVIVIGTGIGAYVGSLTGAMSHTRKSTSEMTKPEAAAAETVRHAGVLLATHVTAGSAASAIAILRECGAVDVEQANGKWSNGEWVDFDPTSVPVLV